MALPNQPGELTELLAMVDSGRFMQVQAWITAGKPLHRPEEKPSRCPLYRAVRSGGHDMVALLLQATKWPSGSLDQAVRLAAENNEGDIAGLLFAAGANAAAVKPGDACRGDGKLMQACARAGVDLTKYNAFADALGTGARPPLGALLTLRKDFPALEHQAAIALCRAIQWENMGVLAKLVWAKADPFLSVQYDGNEWSAAEVACRETTPAALSALHLRPTPEQCMELIGILCSQPCAGILMELLKFTTADQLNTGPQASCVALHRLLSTRRMLPGRGSSSVLNQGFADQLHAETVGSIIALLDHGAHWNPTPAMFEAVSRAFKLHMPGYVEPIVRRLGWSESIRDEEAASMLRTEMQRRIASINVDHPYKGLRRRGRPPGVSHDLHGPPCPPEPPPRYYYGNNPDGPRRRLTRKRKANPGWINEPAPRVIFRKRKELTDRGLQTAGDSSN